MLDNLARSLDNVLRVSRRVDRRAYQQGFGRFDNETRVISFVEWSVIFSTNQYDRVLPPVFILEFGPGKGFGWWTEIGVKWCTTGLVTLLES